MGVDGLAAHASGVGDLLHAGIGPFDEHGAGRPDDRVDAALRVGATAASPGFGLGSVSHHREPTPQIGTLTSRQI